MKLTLKTLAVLAVLSAGIATDLTAQPMAGPSEQHDSLRRRRPPRHAPRLTPEEVARRQADRLKDSLLLTDKQYKKVYKLYLDEQEERAENRPTGPRGRSMGMGGGFQPMGGGGMPPQMEDDGGFPPMTDTERPQRPTEEERQAFMEARKKEAQERAKKLDKKMKKILTDEQYVRWKELKPALPPRPGNPRDAADRS